MFLSRVGRANKNGAPAFALATCNANESWIKPRIYDKFKDPKKNGSLAPNQCVIEFDLIDSFLGPIYYQQFEMNPEQWKARYLRNDWNYGDDTNSLFKYRHMDSIGVDKFKRGTKILAIDAARINDRTVGALWENNDIPVLVDIHMFKDRKIEMDYDEQAKLIYEYCKENDIGYENIWIDAVGEGQGLITALKTLYDWRVNSFVGSSEPESKKQLQKALARASNEAQKRRIRERQPVVYSDLRSEQIILFATATDQATVNFYSACPYLAEMKKEATMHNSDIKGKVMYVESKSKVKERTSMSPDVFDCVVMGYYGCVKGANVGTYGNYNPNSDIDHLSTKGRTITGGLYNMKF
jgi:hypothetical protein